MTVPSTGDFNLYDGTPITNTDWDANFTQVVTFLTNGNYDMTFNSISATTYTGLPTDTFTLTTGEDITAGDVIRISGGNAYKASNTTSAGITSVAGIATTTASSGTSVTISYGYYNSLSSLNVGSTYYVGNNGAITITKPQNYPFEIGTAVSETRINMLLKEDPTPAGNVIPYSIATAPEGYILCNGADVSRVTHARLFSVIGTTYGSGDGSTTFALPELRAEFIRGLDLSRGIDTGRTIGSAQADEFKEHRHQANRYGAGTIGNSSGRIPRMSDVGASLPSVDNATNLTGGTETRPANVALAYCIKL
jgi:microcystin-dependent protein